MIHQPWLNRSKPFVGLTLALGIGGGIALASLAGTSEATIYYVDYEHGDDGAAGTSPDFPWKRAPGDPQATGKPKAVKLEPGDTVRFRGGVSYRGSIRLPASGAADRPITYSGDEWGESAAIFNGSDPVIEVRPCPDADACGGAPNWPQLSVVVFNPVHLDIVKFFDAEGQLYESQYPSPKDPFFIGRYSRIPSTPAT